ncbi:hypothetical protein V2J09_020182 [Rumex salicifolius]
MAGGGPTVGHKIFSKQLTATDLDHRLHWPSEYLAALPDFNGGHHVDFTAKDADGTLWRFRCSKRTKGPYGKPVVSRGWLPFMRSKGQLAAGDDVIFYSSEDPTAHFAIRFNKKVMLFGSNINDAEI